MRTLCFLLVSVSLFAERVPGAKIELTPELLGISPELAPGKIPVWDLAYSPDGTMLAIGAGVYFSNGISGVVLIVSAKQPDVVLHRFEVLRLPFYFDQQGAILWLPQSDGLIVSNRTTLLDLNDSTKSRLPNWGEAPGGFLSNRRVITSRSTPGRDQIGFNVRKIGGTTESSWLRPMLTSTSGISAKRDLIALCKWQPGADGIHDNFCETELVDTEGLNPQAAWQAQRAVTRLSYVQFTDEGRQVCAGKYRGYRTPSVFACWSTETGEQMAQLDDLGFADGSFFSTGGTRVAMNDFDVSVCPVCEAQDLGPLRAIFKRRVVWDFGTNKLLASWIPETQSVQDFFESQPRELRVRFALSPDGKSLAEGGAGVVQLYDVVADPE